MRRRKRHNRLSPRLVVFLMDWNLLIGAFFVYVNHKLLNINIQIRYKHRISLCYIDKRNERCYNKASIQQKGDGCTIHELF